MVHFRKHTFFLSLLILISFSRVPVHAVENRLFYPGSPVFGITGGYTHVTGYYASYFNNGSYYGINAAFPLSVLNGRLLADGDAMYEKFLMNHNDDFNLTLYSFRAGPLLFYPMFNSLYPFIAAYAQYSNIYFITRNSGVKDQSRKGGYALKAGTISPLYGGFGLRLGAEYKALSLSGQWFGQFLFTGSLVFSFKGYILREEHGRSSNGGVREKSDKGNVIEDLLFHGLKLFNDNRVLESREPFSKALALDRGNREAEKYLAFIADYERRLKTAEDFMEKGNFYEAIPILVGLRPYLRKADDLLRQARGKLLHEMPGMEKRGIDAYENRDYDLSIQYMEKLLLIDPDNNTAKIYLPRSRNRKEALDKLK